MTIPHKYQGKMKFILEEEMPILYLLMKIMCKCLAIFLNAICKGFEGFFILIFSLKVVSTSLKLFIKQKIQ